MYNETLPFILFTALIIALLLLDLGILQRRAHSIGVKEASVLSAMWVALALLFNVFIYFMYENQWLGAGQIGPRQLSGGEAALQFLTGYLVEESLSVDVLLKNKVRRHRTIVEAWARDRQLDPAIVWSAREACIQELASRAG